MIKRRTGPHERSIRELRLDHTGLRVGQPLTDFQGIMSGQLLYLGQTELLAERNR
jgi:circadian clock protein KaiC